MSRAAWVPGMSRKGKLPVQEDNAPHLSTKALAARWTTTTGRLGNMRCEGRGPAYLKIGSRVLYRLSDVEAYETAHLIPTLDAA